MVFVPGIKLPLIHVLLSTDTVYWLGLSSGPAGNLEPSHLHKRDKPQFLYSTALLGDV